MEPVPELISWRGSIPYEWCHSPFEHTVMLVFTGIINAPALFILTLITLILIKGTAESAVVNAVIVVIKVSIVIVFITLGWKFINPTNYVPFLIPADAPDVIASNGEVHSYAPFFNHGWAGIFRGASIVFFAFIGFDAVSTAAQETKNPKRDMPIGILGSLVICTYSFMCYFLTCTHRYCTLHRFYQRGKRGPALLKCYSNLHAWLRVVGNIGEREAAILARVFNSNSCDVSWTVEGVFLHVK